MPDKPLEAEINVAPTSAPVELTVSFFQCAKRSAIYLLLKYNLLVTSPSKKCIICSILIVSWCVTPYCSSSNTDF